MTSLDPARASATDLAAALRAGDVSSVELVTQALARVDAHDGDVNALVVRDPDRAFADARAADRALAAGDRRPLLGVPISVKESFDLRGHPTTWGFGDLSGHRADRDALAVRRLTGAGAVVIGKTNVPVALNDWQSENPIYGRTRNPYDLARSPGGSSGGSAVALALGYSALELGSDIGGSVRVPAAFCGVFGHKPTWGIVPHEGHSPGGWDGVGPPLAVIGPLARSAADLDLAIGLLAAPDDMAPATAVDLAPPRRTDLGDLRALVLDEHPSAATDPVVRAAVRDVAAAVAASGASVSHGSDLLPDLARVLDDYRVMLAAVGSRRAPAGTPSLPVKDWFDLVDRQLRVRRQWATLFERFDVVIAPVFGTVAFELFDEPDPNERMLRIDGQDEPFEAQLAWPSLATFANLPATAAPIGITADGLPLSVQVIGPHLGDRTTIAVAGMIAREIPPPAPARRTA